jgi:hypothetical protein
MSGRGIQGSGRGGRGTDNKGCGGRGRGRGSSCTGTGTAAAKHNGLCIDIGNHVFDYGQKEAADQMRTTWEKTVHHMGAIYGHEISNELLNKKTVIIPEPAYTQEVMDKHDLQELRHKSQQQRLAKARRIQSTALKTADKDVNTGPTMKMAILENEVEEATYQDTIELPIKLIEIEQTHH